MALLSAQIFNANPINDSPNMARMVNHTTKDLCTVKITNSPKSMQVGMRKGYCMNSRLYTVVET